MSNNTADARRARKREQDRHSQRVARERNKKRLAYLETLVVDLKQQNTTEQVQALLRQRDEVVKERDTLLRTLKSIKRVINGQESSRLLNEKPDPCEGDGSDSSHHERNRQRSIESPPGNQKSLPDTDPQPKDPQTPFSVRQDRSITEEIEDCQDMMSDVAQFADIADFNPDIDQSHLLDCLSWDVGRTVSAPPNDPIFPQATTMCDCSQQTTGPLGREINLWRFANETLTRPTEWTQEIFKKEMAMEQDTAVRAIVEGWPAVERRAGGTLPPSWQTLRKIDEAIFINCGFPERLAMLQTMYILFRYHQETTAERLSTLPAWYLARPSQTIAHSYAIDYFAWPGIRERFVFSQHRYCSNLFWQYFQSGIHILWPYEFRDCYTRNLHTGEYCISPDFKERIQDINVWTMSPDIFKVWPELSSDIPTYNALPRSVSSAEPWRVDEIRHNRSLLTMGGDGDAQALENDPKQNGEIEHDGLSPSCNI